MTWEKKGKKRRRRRASIQFHLDSICIDADRPVSIKIKAKHEYSTEYSIESVKHNSSVWRQKSLDSYNFTKSLCPCCAKKAILNIPMKFPWSHKTLTRHHVMRVMIASLVVSNQLPHQVVATLSQGRIPQWKAADIPSLSKEYRIHHLSRARRVLTLCYSIWGIAFCIPNALLTPNRQCVHSLSATKQYRYTLRMAFLKNHMQFQAVDRVREEKFTTLLSQASESRLGALN